MPDGASCSQNGLYKDRPYGETGDSEAMNDHATQFISPIPERPRREPLMRRVTRWLWWLAAFDVTVTILLLSLAPPSTKPLFVPIHDKIAHLGAYAVLVLIWSQAFSRQWPHAAVPKRLAAVGGLGLFVGLMIEVLQTFVDRHFSLWDLAADGVGIALALGLWLVAVRWYGRRVSLAGAGDTGRPKSGPAIGG